MRRSTVLNLSPELAFLGVATLSLYKGSTCTDDKFLSTTAASLPLRRLNWKVMGKHKLDTYRGRPWDVTDV